MPSYTLHKGTSLLLEGPLTVKLVSGEATCLGTSLANQSLLTVREDRQVPIEADSEATIDVRMSRGAKVSRVEGSTIPVGWREAATLVLQARGTVAILGDVDSGKSTLATLLANECFRNGLHVGVVDADIGQADVGPATTISFSTVLRHIFSLQDLTPERALFIGDTSPSLVSGKLFRSITRLKDEAATRTDVLLVNTDGWVRGNDAVRYKLDLLGTIHPELVLGIAQEKELEPILELQKSTSLRLERSKHAKTRSREERKRAREYGYRRFLQGAERLEFQIDRVKLRRFDLYKQLKLSADEDLRGVLAGLLDEQEWLLSIGRVERFEERTITVRAKPQPLARTIELGAVVLSQSYDELGFET